MPTNKNASIRYQALDKCFRDKYHRYYMEDLIDKCEEALFYYNGVGGVSRRQIFEDIKYMESEAGWSADILRKKDGKKVYYRYADWNFAINSQPLTDDEARQMETAILTLSRFRGMPSNEWIDEVISSLEWRFNLKGESQNVIGFEQNLELKGLNYLAPLIDATTHHKVLKIVYRNYKEGADEKTVIAHPYYVKQYNNRWFLMALDDSKRYISNFALDRIMSVETTDKIRFIDNTNIDFEHYFDDVIGVTIPKEDVKKIIIELQLTPNQYPYVVSKPLHSSQRIIDEDNRIITIEVRPNYELDHHILSLGPDITVLSPESYRTHIMRKIQDNLNKYLVMQNDCTNNK